ncbi:MAG: hypothetical protein NG740_01840 [Omnitrophica bacterium]|nr:hypothetical protein [Candidatus Omnitrophota bacterium]
MAFIGKKIHVKFDYKNHAGFVSCFLLRHIALEKPVVLLKDFDLALGCEKALIRPGFGKLLSEKKIILNCTLKNASLLSLREKIQKNGEFAAFFQGALPLLFDKLTDLTFDSIHTVLIIYGETIEFPHFAAYARDCKLYAKGYATESGSFNIRAKMFFSPEIVRDFPEELKAVLTEESRGWLSYYAHVEGGSENSSFKLESDRFRINFEKLEVK